MIGVTIGVGRAYREMAELAAESVQKWTGLNVRVVTSTQGCHPAKYKLLLLEQHDETVFYFDADTRMIGPWPEIASYEDRTDFIASKHDPTDARDRDCGRYGLDNNRYFYSGLWFANRKHHGEAFHAAYELCHSDDYRTEFQYEQTALNVAIQRYDIQLAPVPWERHVVCDNDNASRVAKATSMLHIAGSHLQGVNRRIFEREILRRERCN